VGRFLRQCITSLWWITTTFSC